jgi:4'-phosphopantetheinyl transferase
MWPAARELPILKNNDVHVWLASLEMPRYQVGRLAQLLSPDELEKARGFHFQTDRDRFVAARGILRSVLGKYLKVDPDKLIFYYGPYGKPMLAKRADPSVIQFNLSHSHGLALCAVAMHEVGVDLEYIYADCSFEGIAKQFFSLQEVTALNSCPQHLRKKLFFHFWTRKEAYLKARGLGLSGDLKQYQITKMDGSGPVKSPWALIDLAVPPGYAAALAVKGHNLLFDYWQWEECETPLTKSTHPAR